MRRCWWVVAAPAFAHFGAKEDAQAMYQQRLRYDVAERLHCLTELRLTTRRHTVSDLAALLQLETRLQQNIGCTGRWTSTPGACVVSLPWQNLHDMQQRSKPLTNSISAVT